MKKLKSINCKLPDGIEGSISITESAHNTVKISSIVRFKDNSSSEQNLLLRFETLELLYEMIGEYLELTSNAGKDNE